MISLQRLEGFYWVARHQSYAKAARHFPYPITQPGVHQQVTRLEKQLGAKLFERVGKDRMILSPAGHLLFEAVGPMFEKLATVEDAIKTGTVSGLLRFDASGHVLRYVMPPWLRRIRSKHPGLRLELNESKVPEPERLRAGLTDVIVDHMPSVPSDLRATKVAVARAFVVVGAHRKGSTRLSDLEDEPFIAYGADRQSRDLQLTALSVHGIEPKTTLTADSAETILGFIAAGLGYSLVPSVLPNGPREVGVTTTPLARPAAEFPVYAVQTQVIDEQWAHRCRVGACSIGMTRVDSHWLSIAALLVTNRKQLFVPGLWA